MISSYSSRGTDPRSDRRTRRRAGPRRLAVEQLEVRLPFHASLPDFRLDADPGPVDDPCELWLLIEAQPAISPDEIECPEEGKPSGDPISTGTGTSQPAAPEEGSPRPTDNPVDSEPGTRDSGNRDLFEQSNPEDDSALRGIRTLPPNFSRPSAGGTLDDSTAGRGSAHVESSTSGDQTGELLQLRSWRSRRGLSATQHVEAVLLAAHGAEPVPRPAQDLTGDPIGYFDSAQPLQPLAWNVRDNLAAAAHRSLQSLSDTDLCEGTDQLWAARVTVDEVHAQSDAASPAAQCLAEVILDNVLDRVARDVQSTGGRPAARAASEDQQLAEGLSFREMIGLSLPFDADRTGSNPWAYLTSAALVGGHIVVQRQKARLRRRPPAPGQALSENPHD
ncbi:MAG: hypothetical protein AB7F89_01225 [Pirellulaceae bacterium]